MKSKTVLKSNQKTRNIDNIDTSNTHIHDRSVFWLCAGTSVKSGWVEPSLLVK